jgi:hypothetical protein
MNLYIETLNRTKPRQLFYRIYYSLRSTGLGLIIYKPYILFNKKKLLNRVELDYDFLFKFFNYYQVEIPIDTLRNYKNSDVIKDNKLTFLNSSCDFNAHVWDYKDKSILWNYQLNYMSWLGDLLYQDVITNQKKNQGYIVKILKKWTIYKAKVSCRPYPTSLRLFIWVQFLAYYKIEDNSIIESLIEQYIDLKSSIEYELDGNHVLENYIALYLVASFLKLEDDFNYYSKKLLTEITRQFDINGLHYERSFAYHFSIVERLIVLCEISTGELNARLRIILSQSFEILKQVSNNEGLPLFHDASHDMYREMSHLESLLKAYASVSKVELLVESKYLVIDNKNVKFIMDVGRATPSYQPAHYHCSMTSYIVNINDNPLIIDTGVYGYYEDERRRLHSRKTSSHNILGLRNEEQSNIWSVFRLGKSALIKSSEVTRSQSCNVITIKYLAFPSLGWVECKRVVILSLNFFGIIVADLAGKYQNDMVSHVVIDPSFQVTEKNRSFFISSQEQKYQVTSTNSVEVVDHEVYKKMGNILQTSKIIFSNMQKNKLNNSCVSYSIFDEKYDFSFDISENKIIVSNGLEVNLV